MFPHLSAAYALKIFSQYIMDVQYKFIIESMLGETRPDAPEFGYEMHAVSSACKPLAGWLVRDGIQECREVCAGHGYLKSKI